MVTIPARITTANFTGSLFYSFYWNFSTALLMKLIQKRLLSAIFKVISGSDLNRCVSSKLSVVSS